MITPLEFETPLFQYFYHVSDRRVQCAIESNNPMKQLYSIAPHITAGTVLPLQQGLWWERREKPDTFWPLAMRHHGGHYSVFPTSGAVHLTGTLPPDVM